MSAELTVAAAVTRSHLRRHWRALVLLGLVVGLVGGVAAASFAGARRTSTAYDRLLEASDHSDAYLQLLEAAPALVRDVLAAPSVERAVDALYVVGRHTEAPNVVLFPVQASTSGLGDPVLRRGRLPDPAAIDEVVLTERSAEQMGIDVGDVWPYQALTHDEFADLLRDRWEGTASGLRVDLRVVGIVRAPTDAILADFPFIYGTPALHQALDDGPGATRGVWIHFAEGAGASDLLAEVPALGAAESEDAGFIIDFTEERRALDRGVSVLVAGLVAFGAAAAVAGVVVVGQLVGRAVQRTADDRRVLRDLGLARSAVLPAAVGAGALSVVVAAATTVVVALIGSRWTPIGVTRGIEASPGVGLHVPIVLGGVVVVTAVLVVLATSSVLRTPRMRSGTSRPQITSRLAAVGTGPVPSVGAVLAFGGDARRGGPNRVAFAGVVVAMAGIVAALVFASSLDRLVEDTERWGWTAHQDVELPAPVRERTYAALDADPEVEAYGELIGDTASVDGVVVDAYSFEARKGQLGPAVVDGRAPFTVDEVSLGPSLLDQLGLDIGDEVVVDGEVRRIVGSTLPFARAERSSVTGGILVGSRLDGPMVFTTALVRFADGVDQQAAAERLYGDLEYDRPDPPVDVVNLGRLQPLPVVLAGVLGVVGLVALAQVALGIAGRSRTELAVLRSLGMPRRSAARTVLAAAGLVGVVASAFGALVGLVLGRLSWGAAAATTQLATDAMVPVTVALVLAGAAMVVMLAGTAAGRLAVRRPAGEVLRSE